MHDETSHDHVPQCIGMHIGDNGAEAWLLFFEKCRELAATARQRRALRLNAQATSEASQPMQEGSA